MKTANSRIVIQGKLDAKSVRATFSFVPVDSLKDIAQALRERRDWYGDNENDSVIYNCCLEVIRISEPDYDTTFTPQN